jgi:hypothetical protein
MDKYHEDKLNIIRAKRLDRRGDGL